MNIENHLVEEYKMLSNYFEKTASIQFTMFPIFITAIVGFISFRLSDPSIVGILFQLFLLFLLVFLGFSHSMLQNYGLKLVEIELKINKNLGLEENEQYSYFTKMLGEGADSIIFFKTYIILLVILLSLLYAFAEYNFWIYMVSLCVPVILIIIISIVKFLFVIAILKPLLGGDKKIIAIKQTLINKYKNM
jgi:hypothetical protein